VERIGGVFRRNGDDWLGLRAAFNGLGHEPEWGVSLQRAMTHSRRGETFQSADRFFSVKGNSISVPGTVVDACPATPAFESFDSARGAHLVELGGA
jgi:hypothetical protein